MYQKGEIDIRAYPRSTLLELSTGKAEKAVRCFLMVWLSHTGWSKQAIITKKGMLTFAPVNRIIIFGVRLRRHDTAQMTGWI